MRPSLRPAALTLLAGLALPAPAFDWLETAGLEAAARLAQAYGGRLAIRAGQTLTPEVKPDA